jgi:DNA-binding response OmpR family regulator
METGAADPGARQAGEFVLIVDDNPETLTLFAQALRLEGFEVRTASGVFQALERLHDASPRPSLIITDLLMPRTTGWDFLRHLRAESAVQTIPIIVVTGAEPGDSETLADIVLQKPIDPARLADAARALLTR